MSQTNPPSTKYYLLSFPRPHILLVTINREKQLNALNNAAHYEGNAIFNWFDEEPSLRVAIITGKGNKSFCAGQDLIEQADNVDSVNSNNQTSDGKDVEKQTQETEDKRAFVLPPGGFMGVSRRRGKKPIIAAVNGYALGGGFEICLNCDMIIASPTATFGLPEAQVGLYAAAGGLPRLARICGMQLASELALTNRRLTAAEAKGYFLVNRISATPESLLSEALDMAQRIVDLSPDAIIASRHGLREAWENANVDDATDRTFALFAERLRNAPNFAIGVKAFKEKKKPVWVDSKL